MKFDIVIGNPPYNSDQYLDFVQLGFDLSSDLLCMITPAKWQAKGGVKNAYFRERIVPHMSKIVYYPNAGDIFNIRNLDGICYYLVDKNTYIIKDIKNIDFHENHTLFNQDWHESSIEYTLHNGLVNGIIAKTKVNTGQNIKPYYRQDDSFLFM